MWTQRGHSGCASTGTNACIDGIVGVRIRHVIDRERAQSAWHLAPVLVSEDSSTQDCFKKQRKAFMIQGKEWGIDRVKKKTVV